MSPLKNITNILLISSVLIAVFLVIFLTHSLKESALNQWIESRSQSVSQLSMVVEDELSESQRKLELIAGSEPFQVPIDPSLIDRSVNGIPVDVEPERREIIDWLMAGQNPGFDVVFVLLPNGDHFLSHPFSIQKSLKTYNLAHRPYFAEATQTREAVVSNCFQGADGVSAVALDLPVLDENGEIAYHIGGVFHLVRAGHLICASSLNDQNEVTFLLDRSGKTITSSSDFDHEIAGEVTRVVARKSDTSGSVKTETIHFADGKKKKIIIIKTLTSGWTLGIVADPDQVMAHFQPQVLQTAAFAGLIMLIISSIAFYLIKRVGMEWEISYRKTESALHARKNLFDAITNQSVDGITVADTEGNYTFVNPAFCKMVGYSELELLKMTVFDMKAEGQDKSSFAHSKTSKEGLPIQVYLKRKNGSEFFSEVLGKVIEIGKKKAVLGIVRDITDRLSREEERMDFERQVQHAQKLESLGVLAGGIAHDFNNLLMAILGNADLALSELSPMSPVRENLREIESASRRAAELARQMLAYSGKGRFVVESIALGVLVREIAHLLEVSISKKVTLRFNLAENLPVFDGDVTQIRQVVMNLITNASEAIGDQGGIVTLTTGTMDCDRDYLDNANNVLSAGIDRPLEEGVYAYLEVTDTGCGMDKDTVSRIFDPFFTTKFTGRGLGMSAVQGIVRGHHGAIMVYSEPGNGTTFKILFKALANSDESAISPVTAGELNGQASSMFEGTILIVDDEPTVCSVGKQMLKRMGFDVLVAADGREGLEVFEAERSRIVCVLLDLTMPNLDGVETFREMRRLNPEISIILCSGYNEVDATQNFTGKGLAGFLQKPYSMKTLHSKMLDIFSE